MSEVIPPNDRQQLAIRLSTVFTPAAPISTRDLFSGRVRQLRDVIDAVNQRGQHAIIYGERGVGKTSLATVLAEFLPATGTNVLAPKVTCDSRDTFDSIWRKALEQIEMVETRPGLGLAAQDKAALSSLAQHLPDQITPIDVQRLLTIAGSNAILIVIIDEFDRLQGRDQSALFADTIKGLSDQATPATLVLVGVADTVDELISEHLSIERALVQVRMPRMSRDELHEIVERGFHALRLSIEPEALTRISTLSQGLPHYTHLLALHAGRVAIDAGQRTISTAHVGVAVQLAVERAQQTIISAYHQATMSSRKDHLYDQVLLASALAGGDDLGYFSAGDVRGPMSRIMRRSYDTPAFARHLNDFCDKARGAVLERIDEGRRVRFRFTNPLMQPYVIMHGLASNLIDATQLSDD